MVRLGSLAGLHATSCFLEVVLSVSASFTLKTDTSWPHNQASCLENYIKEEGLNQLWMCARAQNFVENFSEFSAAQRNTGKHVTLMSELSRLVDARTLMQVLSSTPCCLVLCGFCRAASSDNHELQGQGD